MSVIMTGLMGYVPSNVSNLLGSVTASAVNKDTKICDGHTSGVYGEFVIKSATVVPKEILIAAIKESGLYTTDFSANKSSDVIIAKAVADNACILTPPDHISVVVKGSDNKYYSPNVPTACPAKTTTVTHTQSKKDGKVITDTKGYGGFLMSQCVPIPCKVGETTITTGCKPVLVCKEGEIKVMEGGVEVCKPKPTDCPANTYKAPGSTTCAPIPCGPGFSGSQPNCIPVCTIQGQTIIGGVCQCPANNTVEGAMCKPIVCPAYMTGTYPNCALPVQPCVAPAIGTDVSKGCQCPATMTYINGACQCPGQVLDASGIKCNAIPTPDPTPNPTPNPTPSPCVFPATPSVTSDPKNCSCPPGGFVYLNGSCQCPAGQVMKTPTNDGCIPAPTTPGPNPTPGPCTVTGQTKDAAGNCVCPADKTIIKDNSCQTETKKEKEKKKGGVGMLPIIGGIAALGLGAALLLGGKKSSSTTTTGGSTTTTATGLCPTGFRAGSKDNYCVQTNCPSGKATYKKGDTGKSGGYTIYYYRCSAGTTPSKPSSNYCVNPTNGGSKSMADWIKSKDGKVTPSEYRAKASSLGLNATTTGNSCSLTSKPVTPRG